MTTTSLLLVAIPVLFFFVWALVAWLKFREHHHIIHHESREKTHLTGFFKWPRNADRQ